MGATHLLFHNQGRGRPIGGGGDSAIPDPSGGSFSWLPFTIEKSGANFHPKDWSIESNQSAVTKAYYVDQATGNDGNSGTAALPLLKISTAVQKVDADLVYIMPGTYKRTNGLAGIGIARSMSLKKWPGETGDVIITCAQDGLSWTLDDTATYFVSRSSTYSVLDVSRTDANGNYEQLVKRADVAGVKANPGSWYLDGSNNLWVQAGDSRALDANIWPMVAANGYSYADIHIYCENIKFYGGQYGAWRARDSGAGQTPEFYAKNCEFAYSATNGFTNLGCVLSVLENCVAYANLQDGFNYHADNSIVPNAIEINCIGRDNGTADATGNDNGSTSHDAGSVVRIGGEYENNVGPNVIDDASTTSWNLGSYAHDSASDVAGAVVDFDTAGTMWLDTCQSGMSTYALVAGAGATLYHRNHVPTGATTGGAGTVTPY